LKEYQKNSIERKRIFFRALLIRLLILLLIFAFNDSFEEGFVESSTYYDDYRYEQGAFEYAEKASSIIDVNAFTAAYATVGDWVGYHFIENPLDSSPLWYWIVCIVAYIFRTRWIIRILNVILASLAIVFVGEFASMLCSKKATNMAISLLTFLPYPVIFSCFAYKDQLVMLCTFYLLYAAMQYRLYGVINIIRIIIFVFAAITLLFTRGGLTAVVLALCACIAFIKSFRLKIQKRQIILLILVVVGLVAVISRSFDTILFKMQYYFTRHKETLGGTTIRFITINGLGDIYKLPFTYIFSIIMPVQLFGNIKSWYSIVANCSVIMTPIAVGATLYAVKRNKIDKVIYWGCMALYLASIVTSINIFRHYYSLMPLSLIFFSDYWDKSDATWKGLVIILALLFSMLLIIFYGLA